MERPGRVWAKALQREPSPKQGAFCPRDHVSSLPKIAGPLSASQDWCKISKMPQMRIFQKSKCLTNGINVHQPPFPVFINDPRTSKAVVIKSVFHPRNPAQLPGIPEASLSAKLNENVQFFWRKAHSDSQSQEMLISVGLSSAYPHNHSLGPSSRWQGLLGCPGIRKGNGTRGYRSKYRKLCCLPVCTWSIAGGFPHLLMSNMLTTCRLGADLTFPFPTPQA